MPVVGRYGIHQLCDKNEGLSVVEKLPNFFCDFFCGLRVKMVIFAPITCI